MARVAFCGENGMGDLNQLSSEQMQARAEEMYFRTGQARAILAASAGAKSAKACRPLFWNAILYTIICFPTFALAQSPLVQENPKLWLGIGCIWGLTLAYWLLWAWAHTAPLPAAITGLVLGTTIFMICTTASAAMYENSGGDSSGGGGDVLMFLAYAFSTFFLVKSIMNGARERQLLKPIEIGAPNKPRSIASAIFLYIVMMDMLTTLDFSGETNSLPFVLFLKFNLSVAVISLTWAICAWRDTLPAVSYFGERKYYLAAVVGGVLLFLIGVVYGGTLDLLFGLPATKIAQPLFEHGLNYWEVLGLVALIPAIFEELAFRGVIVPCLQRALSDKETIFVSAAMFMMMHRNPISAPNLLIGGLGLGLLRIRSKSIWPGVLMHFTNNMLCVVLEKFMV
jgi:uncharacterized protein